MNDSAIWMLLLAIATPVAGVVGFAIQLRQVKKIRLENEKLQLEIAALRASATAAEQRVVIPTNREVLAITRPDGPLFSRPDPNPDRETTPWPKPSLKERLTTLSIGLVLSLMALCLLHDLYRLASWLWGKFQ
ncbi:hypothetical protein [Pseudoxanthomonas winnipegensis]|uniref:Uncharacterized protein n=1 Tax=Pseudoxanthomonas winnipegensis TaxID=2480810 RepID=A0A4Q8LSE3_9GAMM|nr:hypothetical protein [Pseudoxanthomonas winnipegensis]RZZ88369.1 hypothetical protein EA663_05945 [Pseudoxanthomonas winnipegensis]TAA34656.1 hypothetical protein EA656_13195 [Pseudoxanthomonas winnipegensis]